MYDRKLCGSYIVTFSKYCWFGAVRDTANLHGVHPFNRLMDENGEITPLFVLLKSAYGLQMLTTVQGFPVHVWWA